MNKLPHPAPSPPQQRAYLRVWIRASRPASQSYIFLALLFGQAMAFSQHGRWSWFLFVCLGLWGIFDQLYIVYANDLADQEADRLNQTATIFSGGSRVLVDGELTRQALQRGLLLVIVLLWLVSFVLAWYTSGWVLLLTALSLLFLWMYSYPPLRLSYRGGGEFLQMFGIGVILPCLGYLVQAKTWALLPWQGIVVLLPTQLACAMSTALPDAPSDQIAQKRTTAVWMGLQGAKYSILLLHLFSITASAWWFMRIATPRIAWLIIPALSVIMAGSLSPSAHPGTRRLSLMVFFSLLGSLSLLSIHILHQFSFFSG